MQHDIDTTKKQLHGLQAGCCRLELGFLPKHAPSTGWQRAPTFVCVEVAQILEQLVLVAGEDVNNSIILVWICDKHLHATGAFAAKKTESLSLQSHIPQLHLQLLYHLCKYAWQLHRCPMVQTEGTFHTCKHLRGLTGH